MLYLKTRIDPHDLAAAYLKVFPLMSGGLLGKFIPLSIWFNLFSSKPVIPMPSPLKTPAFLILLAEGVFFLRPL